MNIKFFSQIFFVFSIMLIGFYAYTMNKDIKIRKSSKIELEYWTEKLIQDGIKISKVRNKKLIQIDSPEDEHEDVL